MTRLKRNLTDFQFAVLLFLAHLLATIPWLYQRGAGEPDSVAMITGIYQGLLKQTYFDEGLYMLMGQPLYYGIFFALPGVKMLSFDQLALLMNLISWMAGAASTGLFFLLVRRFANRTAAILAALLLISSPTVFEWSTYAHPVTVSIFLLLCAANLAAKILCVNRVSGDSPVRPLRQLKYLLGAAVLAGAAVCVRADVVVLFHVFPLIPWLAITDGDHRHGKPWLKSLAGCAVATTAVIIGFAGLAPFTGSAGRGGGDSPGVLLQTVQSFFRFMPLRDGLLELAFGVGVVGSIYGLAAIAVAAVSRQWKLLLLAILLVVPPLVFAMGNPQPARRFMHAIFAGINALAIVLPGLPKIRRWPFSPSWIAAIFGILAIAGNLFLLPAMGNFLRDSGYAPAKRYLFARATSSVIAHHNTNQRYLLLVERQMKNIRRQAPNNSLLVGSYAHVQFLAASFSRDGMPVSTRLIEQEVGLIRTSVKSGNQTFTVAEYLPLFSSRPPTLDYPAIYTLTNVRLGAASTTATIMNLAPPHGTEFQMWYRP